MVALHRVDPCKEQDLGGCCVSVAEALLGCCCVRVDMPLVTGNAAVVSKTSVALLSNEASELGCVCVYTHTYFVVASLLLLLYSVDGHFLLTTLVYLVHRLTERQTAELQLAFQLLCTDIFVYFGAYVSWHPAWGRRPGQPPLLTSIARVWVAAKRFG